MTLVPKTIDILLVYYSISSGLGSCRHLVMVREMNAIPCQFCHTEDPHELEAFRALVAGTSLDVVEYYKKYTCKSSLAICSRQRQ